MILQSVNYITLADYGKGKVLKFTKRSGHGQIRTADLPLRRRLLYPSELRAHIRSIVPSEAFSSNILTIVETLEGDMAGSAICAVNRVR